MKDLFNTSPFPELCLNKDQAKRDVDISALKFTPKKTPAGLLPRFNIGGGDCVPGALSYLCFGNSNRHVEMRCRMTKELTLNKDLYLDSNFLAAGCDVPAEEILGCICVILDLGGDLLTTKKERVRILENVVFDCRLKTKYLFVWHVHASAQLFKYSHT